jgi:hypothetical protein
MATIFSQNGCRGRGEGDGPQPMEVSCRATSRWLLHPGTGDMLAPVCAADRQSTAGAGGRSSSGGGPPGLIQTDMGYQTFVSRARNLAPTMPTQARRLALSTHPIGRLGTPDDIAKGIVFLASGDTDSWVAGVTD